MNDDELEAIRRRYADAIAGQEAELLARREDQNARPWRTATDEELAEILSGLGCIEDEYAGVVDLTLTRSLIKRIERDGLLLRPPREDD